MILLNDFYSDYSRAEQQSSTFIPFPRFPTKISLAIWKSFLQRYRLITLDIRANVADESLLYSERNNLRNIISGSYQLSIATDNHLSTLLQVNSQSRQAALEYFRVHIPYEEDGQQRYLHLNPDLTSCTSNHFAMQIKFLWISYMISRHAIPLDLEFKTLSSEPRAPT